MTVREFLNKLVSFSEQSEVLDFMNAKLEDGTILQSDNFEVGQEVLIVNEDGTTEVITDGEYIITIPEGEVDVNKVITIVNGVIETIEVKEEEESPEDSLPEVPVVEDMEEEVKEDELAIDPMEVILSKLVELENRINGLEKEKEEEITEPIEEVKEEELEKLDGAPIELQKEKIMDVKSMTPRNKFLSNLYKD